MAGIQDFFAWCEGVIKGGQKRVKEVASSVKDSVPQAVGPLGVFWGHVVDFFTIGFSSVWESFLAYFGEGFRRWGETFSQVGDLVDGVSLGNVYKKMGDMLKDYPEEKKVWDMIAAQSSGFPKLMQVVILVNLGMQMLRTPGAIAYGKIAQDFNYSLSPNPPGPGDVLRAAFVDPSRYEEVRHAMRRGGLSDHDIDLMILANYALYPIEVVRTLYFRGELSEVEVNNRLQEMGFTADRVAEIKKTFPLIPGVQDLVMMLAREAFEPDAISKFGLGAEFPQELVKWTSKQGLSEDWAFKYWVSHWQHPSWQQMVEALHRGIIDYKTIYEWYRLVEIPPYWREMLTKISYSPYTRVDSRRMFNLGVLSRDELKQAYRDMGYDEDHAEKLTQWTVLENAKTNRDITKADILKAFKEGDLANAETLALLVDIGYEQADAEFILIQAENDLLREARNAQIDGLKTLFLIGMVSEAEAKARLTQLGVSNLKVTAYIAQWSAELMKAKKLPSKTDLDKWLRSGLIDGPRYYTEMLKLGYSREYIDLYFKYVTQTKGEL